MREKVHFLDMFSQYQPAEAMQEALSQAVVVSAQIDQNSRSVDMTVFSPSYISQSMLDEASQNICDIYGLRSLRLLAKHPAQQLSSMEPEALMALFVECDSMTRASLAGAAWTWEGQTLTISLLANGKTAIEKCIPHVCNILKDRFDTDVQIQVLAKEGLDGQALFDAMEEMRRNMMSELPKAAVSEKKAAPAQQQTNTIFGRSFKGKSTPMSQLNLDMGNVIVEGRVFSVDHKELKKRNA